MGGAVMSTVRGLGGEEAGGWFWSRRCRLSRRRASIVGAVSVGGVGVVSDV